MIAKVTPRWIDGIELVDLVLLAAFVVCAYAMVVVSLAVLWA